MSLINKKVVTKYGKTGVIESFNGRDLFVNYQEKTGQFDGNGNEMLTVSRKHYDVDSIRNGYLRLEKRQTKQDLIHWINNIVVFRHQNPHGTYSVHPFYAFPCF